MYVPLPVKVAVKHLISVLTKLNRKPTMYCNLSCIIIWLSVPVQHNTLSQAASPSVFQVSLSSLFPCKGSNVNLPFLPFFIFSSLSQYLQRPVLSTMVAVTGHVKIRPLGCAAAAPLGSPCSLMGKPAKVSEWLHEGWLKRSEGVAGRIEMFVA